MKFEINDIIESNQKTNTNNYDISKLLKNDSVNYDEARFVLETLCHEVSQETIHFFVLSCSIIKNVKNAKLFQSTNFFKIRKLDKKPKNKQIMGIYLSWNKEVVILGSTLKLSAMLQKLYLKLRYVNQERRIEFIKKNPELKQNNEQIYLIYKESLIKKEFNDYYKKYHEFFEEEIDANEVSLKQMIGICERFNLNGLLLNNAKKELILVQNRRKKKEYQEVINKADEFLIDF